MHSRRRRAVVISATLSITACAAYSTRTPVLPEGFEGPLRENADSIVASTQPSYCSPARYLDFGKTPQGCVRVSGNGRGWVNWTGAAHVVKVGRDWSYPDGLAAFEAFRSMEGDLTETLGRPVECHNEYQSPARELRWIATQPAGISTALMVYDAVPDRANSAQVVLIRALGPKECGYHVDRPWKH
jgi:hypothetical protein